MSPDELDHWFEVIIAAAAIALIIIYERNDTVRNEVFAWSLMVAMIFAAMELVLNSKLTHSPGMSVGRTLDLEEREWVPVEGKATLEITGGRPHVRNSVASYDVNPTAELEGGSLRAMTRAV